MRIQDAGAATEPTGGAHGTDGSTRDGRRVGRIRRDESGMVLVWSALFLLVLLGFAALAVDLGHSYYVGQKEQDAADAAALAGAVYLPGDLASAQSAAQQVAASNGFTSSKDVTIDAEQDPSNPAQLIVTIHQSIPTLFGGAIGFHTMDVAKTATGVASEASKTKPVDMVLILDRTQSMNAQDLQAVKDASDALLTTLDPTEDSVALGVTGPSLTTQQCGNGAYGVGTKTMTLDMSKMTWIAAPWPNGALETDYQNPDGTLNTSSQIAKTIACLDTSQSNTNLGDPLTAAKDYLAAHGRPGAEQDIILMTDGAANKPDGTQPCEYANDAATTVKNAGVTIITIGFGLDDTSDPQNHCQYDTQTGDPFKDAFATKPLAAMASPINGVAATDDQGCTEAENTDGDNFYCLPKDSGDLSTVFVRAAQSLTNGSPRLVR